MKRCPNCNRIEADEALTFCRLDGTRLVLLDSESTTAMLGSGSVAGTGTAPLSSGAVPLAATSGPSFASGIKRHRLAAVIVVGALVFGVAALGAYLHARKQGPSIDSIAVLPFVNASNDPSTEYLSDGITESIISNLSQLPQLKVMARSTVFRFKGQEIDAQKIGHDLSVRAVLAGRLLQQGDRLVIRTELVNVADGTQLWGAEYDRKLSDVLAVQQDIAREISDKLRLKLSGAEQRQLSKSYTESPEAYQLYLQGRYFWNKRTSDGINKSITYFSRAIENDPGYALAYAGLADAYVVLPSYSQTPSREAYPKAKAAATKALEIDDQLAEAHTSLAMVRFWYDWGAGAEPEFRRALELNPNYATGRHWFALYLSAMGRHNEAIGEMKRAQELDPLSIIINTELGLPYLYARQYDLAIEQFKKAIEMDPNFAFAHFALARAYEQKDRYAEAIAEDQKAVRLSGGDVPQTWAAMTGQLKNAYDTLGGKGYWQKRLEVTKQLYEQHAATAELVAEICAVLGQKDEAFSWLEKSYQQHEDFLVFLKTQPEFDSLRSDPRFADLVRRVGLPP